MNLAFSYKDRLPISLTLGNPACRWFLRNEDLAACAEEVATLIQDPSKIAPHLILKKQTRRLIFKHKSSHGNVLIKAFPLGSIRKRLQHKKYALSEAANLVAAQKRGIPVPELMGYGRQTQWMTVKWNAVCQEFIDAPSLEELLGKARNPEIRYELLQDTFPLFKSLYDAGCNHIDFKPGSVLTRENDKNVIIDWQYVRFLPNPSRQILASQAGYFAWDVSVRNRWIGPEHMNTWYLELLDYLNIDGSAEMKTIFSNTLRARYSIADRLAGKAGLS